METTQIQDKTIQTDSKNLFKEGDTISGSQALLDALVAEGVHTILVIPEEQLCRFMMHYTIFRIR